METITVTLWDIRKCPEKALRKLDENGGKTRRNARLNALSGHLMKKLAPNATADKFGKPRDKDKFFNLSNSVFFIAYAESNAEIGVDVEFVRPVPEKLKKYISSEEEFALITSDTAFFEVWTAKESLVKADGKGIDKAVNKIPALPLCGVKSYNGKKYFSMVKVFDEVAVSVTREGEAPFCIGIEEGNFDNLI